MQRDPIDILTIPYERFEDAWIAEPIFARFETVAARYRDKIAVDDGKLRFTFGELRRAVLRLVGLIERAVPADRPIGIALPNNAQFPIASLACLAAGRPYVPIDLSYPESHNARILAEAGLAAAIVDGAGAYSLKLPASLPLLDVSAALAGAAEEAIVPAPSVGPAFILFTSGSTGQPKGICNDQSAILQRVAQATNACHLNANDRFVLFSSPGTIAGVRESFSALLNGATLFVADPLRTGIAGLLKLVADAQITIAYAVPALLRAVLTAPEARVAFSQLRVLRVGGDNTLDSDLALGRAVLPPFCKILVSFSSTEVPVVFQWFIPSEWMPDSPRLPIGYARRDVSFKLLDTDRVGEPKDQSGELVVRSRYLALGFWQKGRLQPGPFVTDRDDPAYRVFHTGDMVRLREDGLAEMLGRNDRQIKIRGLRADVGQIEAVLRRCYGVADAVVIPRRRGEEVEALVAYVACGDDAKPTLIEDLKQALAANLPRHMRPARIRLLAAIPRLPSFKPDIKELEQLDREELTERRAAEPHANVEEHGDVAISGAAAEDRPRIAEIVESAWTALLDRASFIADQPWDEAGGDSLKALELWFRIERALGKTLPLDSLQAHATPRGLIAVLEKLAESPALAGSEAESDRPTLFLLPGIVGDEPLLVGLRAQLTDRLRFEMLEYPDWDELLARSVSFDAIVNSAVAQILAKAGPGPCFLAGYSFGGFVAHEVGHRLRDAGQPVGLLVLINSRRGVLAQPNQGRRVRGLLSDPQRLPLALERRAIALCIRFRWFGLLKVLAGWVMSRLPGVAFAFRYHLIWMLRLVALKEWRPKLLPVPTILFTSEDQQTGANADLGWRGLCEPLRIAPIGGTHASMLEPPLREKVCVQLLSALDVEKAKSVLADRSTPKPRS